ncbi:MAG: hypothetical protein AAB263_06485, partial [Planctomycetota bacterium]
MGGALPEGMALEPDVARVAEILKEKDAQLSVTTNTRRDVWMRALWPNLHLDFEWNSLLEKVDMRLVVAHRLWGSGRFAEDQKAQAQAEQVRAQHEQLEYDARSRTRELRQRYKETLDALTAIGQELKDIKKDETDDNKENPERTVHGTLARQRAGRIHYGDVAGHIARIARLGGEHLRQMIELTRIHTEMSQYVQLPPLSELLPPLADGLNLKDELNEPAIASQGDVAAARDDNAEESVVARGQVTSDAPVVTAAATVVAAGAAGSGNSEGAGGNGGGPDQASRSWLAWLERNLGPSQAKALEPSVAAG